jgi:3-deoxy-manno-octulosonate cytidylyltransferase (CMP-KDO synthetase)
MRVIGMIPARMGSTRFPGKPLAMIGGKPMIEHVYKRSLSSKSLDAVFIATCDEEIMQATEAFGGQAIMTSNPHERASDRVAEASRDIEADIIVMIQGDEPMIEPQMIDLAVQPLLDHPQVVCSNLAAPIRSEEDFRNPNTIKVAIAGNGDALYFSREPIPNCQKLPFGSFPAFKQVCVIPFRREFLFRYTELEPTPLEVAESVDMLRALEHGIPIRLIETDIETHAVDTPEDLRRVESLMVDASAANPASGEPS